jgi:mannitol-specific phosphotransferase system IIBC component
MTSNISLLTTALVVIAGVMVTLLVVLAVVYLRMKLKEKEQEEGLEKKTNTQTAQKDESKMKQYTVNSVFDFMEFEKIEDNMIVQKKRKKIYYGGRVPRNKL